MLDRTLYIIIKLVNLNQIPTISFALAHLNITVLVTDVENLNK